MLWQLIAGASVFLFLFHHLYWKRRSLPPGPIPIPLIGNFLTILRNEPGYGAFEQWTKVFGGVFTIWIGPTPAVILTDYETIKKHIIQGGDNFVDRYQMLSPEFTKLMRGGCFGLSETSGPLWREQRRFALHTLRDFGLGKNVMEQKVLLEVDLMVARLSQEDLSSPVDVCDHINVAVGSVINNMLYGFPFHTEEHISEFRHLKAMMGEMMKDAGRPDTLLIGIFPNIRYLPWLGEVFTSRFLKRRDRFNAYFDKRIEEHKKDIDYDNDETWDFVEAFMKEQRRREQQGQPDSFHSLQLRSACMDMWVAGMETTSNTIAWALVYLLRNPSILSRVYAELDSIHSSHVSMSDRQNLPLVNAVIMETQRYANVLVMNLMRSTSRETVIEGHSIPAGTCVIPQISTVMYDKKIFPDPHAFNPDRFLSDGQLIKCEQLIPFSVGKRACLGESLARTKLFLFLSNLLFHYSISSVELPSEKKSFGLTQQPPTFKCSIQKRR